ncbi:MAG: esterase-like activity of phytase family protein [Tardiphaga sp.]
MITGLVARMKPARRIAAGRRNPGQVFIVDRPAPDCHPGHTVTRWLRAMAIFLLIGTSISAHAQTVPVPAAASTIRAPVSIEVDARPIPSFDTRDRSHLRFGSLHYRGGLVLTSKYKEFGGLSGLRLDAKGENFIAISDKGNWFTGRIAYSGQAMTGLADVEVAPILGADGRPISARGWYDTESIAVDGPNVYVGLERVHQILKFDFGRDGVRARGEAIPQPPGMRKLPSNGSLESLVVGRRGMALAGTLIAISERGLDPAGNILAWLIGGKATTTFSVRRTENYDISDAVQLPSGDLLLLERKFSLLGGAGVRIRRVALASVVPGATVDGPSIFDADLGYEIDNFEGIEAHVTEEGDTVLTLVSDDNFSMLQRTLLLQFTLVE